MVELGLPAIDAFGPRAELADLFVEFAQDLVADAGGDFAVVGDLLARFAQALRRFGTDCRLADEDRVLPLAHFAVDDHVIAVLAADVDLRPAATAVGPGHAVTGRSTGFTGGAHGDFDGAFDVLVQPFEAGQLGFDLRHHGFHLGFAHLVFAIAVDAAHDAVFCAFAIGILAIADDPHFDPVFGFDLGIPVLAAAAFDADHAALAVSVGIDGFDHALVLRGFGLGVGDRGGQRQGQRGGGDRRDAETASAAGNFGHGEAPQTVDDGLFAQHRTGHRSSQRHVFPGSKAGDYLCVGHPFGLSAASHDARIARRLLVPAHRSPAPPGERIEPVQSQQRLGRDVGDEIVAAMVRKLVRNCHVAGIKVVMRHEGRRQGHHLVGDAEGHRAGDGRGFHQPHLAGFADGNGFGQQVAAHPVVFAKPPAEEHQRPAQPQGQQQFGNAKAQRRRRSRFGGGGRRIGEDEHQRLWRGGSGDGLGHRLCRSHPRRQHQRRHDEAQEGQRPQRIGHLRPAPARYRAAQDQHQRDQQCRVDEGIDQPFRQAACDQAAHFFISCNRRSISAISSGVSASSWARCASKGAARPPNRRSTSRRDSPPT